MTVHSRHIRMTRLSNEEMKAGHDWKPLPDDLKDHGAKVISERYDFDRQAWDVVLWSESFSEVPVDDIVPRIPRKPVP